MHSKHAIQSALSLSLGACVLALNAVASADASWQPQAFSRYEGIISRMPFGAPPPAPVGPTAAELAAKAPPPPFVSMLVLCALNRTPSGGLAVGFMDNSQKPPKSYYLERGDSSDGFTVISASFDQECATIEKDSIQVDLKMGKGGTVATAKPTPVPVALPQSAPAIVAPAPAMNRVPSGSPVNFGNLLDPARLPIPQNVKMIDKALTMGITNESYVDRLKQRREELLAQQATANAPASVNQQATEEKLATSYEAMLRRRNMELIRKGQPGLGIPLTPEEDAQLVSEGVLQAQEPQ